MSHTSVPRWSADPRVPPAGVRTVVLTAGHGDVSALVAELAGPVEVLVMTDPGDELDELLRRAVVGWRFLVAGTEEFAAAVRARLLAAGALDAEITVARVAGERRAVYCAHCRRVTTAEVAVGGVLDCAGCAAPLVVYYHFSRRLGAYLGYRVDAEELEDLS